MLGRSVRATTDEAKQRLPGDDLIPQSIASLIHAITILRPPSEVWPWLAQMGAGSRPGWYSYDFLDNGGRRSAVRIVPELQQLSIGIIFPALPGMSDGFSLLAFERERFLVLGWRAPNDTLLMTWAFILQDTEDRRTRLIVRVCAGPGYQFRKLPWWLGKRIVRIVHFIMQRKQLLGIATRAPNPSPSGRHLAHQRGTGTRHEREFLSPNEWTMVGRRHRRRDDRVRGLCGHNMVSIRRRDAAKSRRARSTSRSIHAVV
jgi:hypothetical protein